MTRLVAAPLASPVVAANPGELSYPRLNCFPCFEPSAETVLKNHSHLGWLAGAMNKMMMVTNINQVPVGAVAHPEDCQPCQEPETRNYTSHKLNRLPGSARSSLNSEFGRRTRLQGCQVGSIVGNPEEPIPPNGVLARMQRPYFTACAHSGYGTLRTPDTMFVNASPLGAPRRRL